MKREWNDIFGLRLKATGVVMLGTVLALWLAASASVIQMRRTMAAEERRTVHDIAQGVGNASELALAVHDTKELQNLADAFLRNDQLVFVALYDESQKLIAKSVRDEAAWNEYTAHPASGTNFMLERQAVNVESQNSDPDAMGGELDAGAEPANTAHSSGATAPLKQVGSVVVGLSTLPGQAALWHEASVIAIASAAATLCAALVTFLFVGKWTFRLDRLIAASQRISQGDLEVAIQDQRTDEIGRLSQAYDRMRQAVRQRDTELREFNDTLQQQVQERTGSLEKALHAAESADKAKSLFLANMSHEIRTPLNGVVGMIDLLRRTSLNESQARFAGVARSSADALLGVINDILDFSKIEAGRMELETLNVDLTSVIETVAETASVLAAKKGLEVGCIIRSDVPECVVGDPGRIGQILNNLMNNAIKFTEKGQVVLAATLLAREGPIARVRFSVSDSGIGIPADRKTRLFQSFSQIDASTTRKYGGTGLGLAISKRLVEMMGGEIGVDSELGQGSTFWFVLPMQVSQPEGDPNLSDSIIARLKNLRVLAVDDNAVNLEIIEQQLSAWRLGVFLAPDAATAIARLTESRLAGTPIDVAVLDWHMPDMDGVELAKMIRATPLIADTTLIMLSSVDDSMIGEEIKKLGFAGHLIKPVRQSRLLDTIANAIGRRAPRPTASQAEAAAAKTALSQRPRSKAHILLAEDNEINRMVAGEILSGCGYTFEMVESGSAALSAAFAKHYDLILMDCQMPDMDGFEATRAIRAREKSEAKAGQPARRIPIVALTANAIKGDRELCLAAGMDDYVSKPVSAEKLVDAVEGMLRGKCEPQPLTQADVAAQAAAATQGDPIDMTAFLDRCMGNKIVAAKVLTAFAKQIGTDMIEMQTVLAAGDRERLTRLAHTLKGSAGNISAEKVRRIVTELEHIGEAGDLSEAARQVASLKEEVERCVNFIHQSQQAIKVDQPTQKPVKN